MNHHHEVMSVNTFKGDSTSTSIVNQWMGALRKQEKELSKTHWSLISNFLSFATKAEQTITEQQQRIALLESLAQTDELTGILNRRGFDKALQRAIERAKRYREVGTLVYMDLNHFKAINDQYGHAAGDKVLNHVAGCLNRTLRKTDSVGRIGGDEFVVLLGHCSLANAKDRVKSLKADLVTHPAPTGKEAIPITFSAGLVNIDPHLSAMEHFALADQAMYHDKNKGRLDNCKKITG